MAKKEKILIEVSGGVVCGVYGNTDRQLDVVVFDHDDKEADGWSADHRERAMIRAREKTYKTVYY